MSTTIYTAATARAILAARRPCVACGAEYPAGAARCKCGSTAHFERAYPLVAALVASVEHWHTGDGHRDAAAERDALFLQTEELTRQLAAARAERDAARAALADVSARLRREMNCPAR